MEFGALVSKDREESIQLRIDELRTRIREQIDPKGISICCGMDYSDKPDGPIFSFIINNVPAFIKFPELIARNLSNRQPLNTMHQALMCYYLITSAGYPPYQQNEKNWVSFADLPSGRFYNQAFQGYTGNQLAPVIEKNIDKFSTIAAKLNGVALDLGDIAFEFKVLPKFHVAIVFWMGDEEFPSNCKILFEVTAYRHLPVDACAIVGSILTQSILLNIKELNNSWNE